MKYLFVGEKRSKLAVKRRISLKDGRLAGKQLFDALKAINIDPQEQLYCNYFQKAKNQMLEMSVKTFIKTQAEKVKIVGMGLKVQKALEKDKIAHIKIVHPAARGTIRKKENYIAHLKEQLYGN